MTYTVIYNWGWYKHEDCRNAYSVHNSNCKIVANAERNLQNNKIQGYDSGYDSVSNAINGAHEEALGRFAETVAKYGFKHMIKICKCAKGA